MAKINMWDYYPFYQHDEYVEVSDELAATSLFRLAERLAQSPSPLPGNRFRSARSL